jgi:hypothetical protein
MSDSPALSQTTARAMAIVERRLREIQAECFIPAVRLTLVARLPTDPDADVIVTADDTIEVIRALYRTRATTLQDPNSRPQEGGTK